MGHKSRRLQPPGAGSPAAPAARRALLLWIVVGLMLVGVALVFGQTARHQFVNLDDGMYVYENPRVSRGFTAWGIAWALGPNESALWVPLTWLSLMLDGQCYGLHAGGYHLSNVLLHAAAAVVLFLALRAMTAQTWPSALAAALFAVHPLRAESVAWVTERKDVLSGLCFMLLLAAYTGYVRHRFSLLRYLAVATLFVLGLTAKPMLVTAPLVLLLLDYWPLGRVTEMRFRSLWPLILEKIPLLALAAGSCLVTLWAQDAESLGSAEMCPLGWRIGHALISYVAYLAKFLYPAGLVAMYPHPGPLPPWNVAAALSILAVITAAAFLARRKCPYCLIGWLWYLGMLVPVIGLVQVGAQSTADRFTYLPEIGLSIALAWSAADVCRRRPGCRLAGSVAAALALAVLTALAWRQTSFWRSGETLWNHALAVSSTNEKAHDLLGLSLADAGRYDEAIAHYRQALEIDPEFSGAHINFGLALCSLRKTDEAIAHFRRALAIEPDNGRAHHDLAVALADQGRLAEAAIHARRALAIKPDMVEAENHLGAIRARQGKPDEAIAHFERALRIQPDSAAAHDNLGKVLVGLGRSDGALAHFRQALEIRPGDAEAHYQLALALADRGQFEEAADHYRQDLAVRPGHAEAHNNLAWLLATCPAAGVRDGAEAVAHAARARQLLGELPGVLDTLAAAQAEAARFPEALATARQALDRAVGQKEKALAEALRRRIALYAAGRPYRQSPAPIAPRGADGR